MSVLPVKSWANRAEEADAAASPTHQAVQQTLQQIDLRLNEPLSVAELPD